MDRSAYQLSLNLDSIARAVAQWTVTRMDEADSTLGRRYGGDWRSRWLRDMQVRIHHLAQAVALRSTDLFVQSIRWSRAAYIARDVAIEDLRLALVALRDVLIDDAPKELMAAVTPYVDVALEALNDHRDDPVHTMRHLDPDGPHGELALRYLEALLDGRQRDAESMILDTAESGVPVQTLYESVLGSCATRGRPDVAPQRDHDRG